MFWQIGSSATLGTSSAFRGTILALTSITVTTGATIEGRVLARNGAVTLDTNVITRPTCAAVVPTVAPTATATPTGTATPSATATPTATSSVTPSGTASASVTPAPSATATSTVSASATVAPTASQVVVVPSGPVRTGDGSSRRSGGTGWATGLLLVVAAGAGATAFAVRRRSQDG